MYSGLKDTGQSSDRVNQGQNNVTTICNFHHPASPYNI